MWWHVCSAPVREERHLALQGAPSRHPTHVSAPPAGRWSYVVLQLARRRGWPTLVKPGLPALLRMTPSSCAVHVATARHRGGCFHHRGVCLRLRVGALPLPPGCVSASLCAAVPGAAFCLLNCDAVRSWSRSTRPHHGPSHSLSPSLSFCVCLSLSLSLYLWHRAIPKLTVTHLPLAPRPACAACSCRKFCYTFHGGVHAGVAVLQEGLCGGCDAAAATA